MKPDLCKTSAILENVIGARLSLKPVEHDYYEYLRARHKCVYSFVGLEIKSQHNTRNKWILVLLKQTVSINFHLI